MLSRAQAGGITHLAQEFAEQPGDALISGFCSRERPSHPAAFQGHTMEAIPGAQEFFSKLFGRKRRWGSRWPAIPRLEQTSSPT